MVEMNILNIEQWRPKLTSVVKRGCGQWHCQQFFNRLRKSC